MVAEQPSQSLQSRFKPDAKRWRKRFYLQSPLQIIAIAFVKSIEPEHGAHRHGARVAIEDLDGVSGGYRSGFENPIVESAVTAFEEGFQDRGIADFVDEFETGKAATGDLEDGAAVAMDIPDADFGFEEA